MAWNLGNDPNTPAPPPPLDPIRCMNCGHLTSEHDDTVGCTVDGGSKFIVNDAGDTKFACACPAYVPPQS